MSHADGNTKINTRRRDVTHNIGQLPRSSLACVTSSAMRVALVPLFLCLLSSVNALHFYLDANQKRCFIEELPTDTVVEGRERYISLRHSK